MIFSFWAPDLLKFEPKIEFSVKPDPDQFDFQPPTTFGGGVKVRLFVFIFGRFLLWKKILSDFLHVKSRF